MNDKVVEWYNKYNVEIAQDINILEIGCRRGYLHKTVIDVSPKTIELARQTKFLIMDAEEKLDLPDHYFDKVFAHGSLECVKDMQTIIGNVSRVMRMGGTFVFTAQRETLLFKMYRKWFRKPQEKDLYFTMKQYRIKELKRMLNRAGLIIEKVDYLYYGSIYLISARKIDFGRY